MIVLVSFLVMFLLLVAAAVELSRRNEAEERREPLRVGGRPAELREQTDDRPDTVLTVGRVDGRNGEWRVFDAGLKRSGQEDQRIGDRVFDRAWVLQGVGVKRLFAPEVRQEVIAALTALRRFKRPRVTVGPDGLEIRVRHRMKGPDARQVLLRAAETLLGATTGMPEPEGIVWMSVRENGPVLCQICGSDIQSAPVLCRACRTPHHEDCWAYTRRCSTFGCGERRSVRA